MLTTPTNPLKFRIQFPTLPVCLLDKEVASHLQMAEKRFVKDQKAFKQSKLIFRKN